VLFTPDNSSGAPAQAAADVSQGRVGIASGFGPVEPQITVNPSNPANLILTDQYGLQVSTDGGATFGTGSGVGKSLSFPLPAGVGFSGDTRTVFDSNGNLWWANLGTVSGVLSIFVTQVNPQFGTQIGTTQRVTTPPVDNPTAPKPFPDYDDKADLAADSSGHLFMAWSRNTSTGWQIRLAKGTNTGTAQSPTMSWTTEANQTVVSSGEGFVWPASVTTDFAGNVFVAYHSEPSNNPANGQVLMARYNNDLFFRDKTNVFGGQGTAKRRGSYPTLSWTGGVGTAPVAGPVVLHAPSDTNVYVVSVNDPSSGSKTGDPADIIFARNPEDGTGWKTSTLEAGPTNSSTKPSLEILPTAAVDDFGDIVVAWYDGRNGGTTAVSGSSNGLLDIYAKYSTDGGASWTPAFQVNGSNNRFDPGSGRIMDYFGITIFDGTVYVAWVGNTFTGGVADANSQQVWTSTFAMRGTLTITNDSRSSPNTITIQNLLGNSPELTVVENGVRTYAGLNAGLEDLTVNGESVGLQVNLLTALSTGGMVSVHTNEIAGQSSTVDIEASLGNEFVTLGAGTDTVNLTTQSHLFANDLGSVTITGNANAFDTLVIDDGADSSSPSWTIDSSTINDLSVGNVHYSQLSAITIDGGNGDNTTFDVQDTLHAASMNGPFGMTIDTGAGRSSVSVEATTNPLQINGQGTNVSVTLGNTTSGVQEINGSVTLTSPDGAPSADLTIDDSADSGQLQSTVVLDAASLTGLAPAAIHFGAANLSALTIVGGMIGDAFSVTDTPNNEREATVTTIKQLGIGTVDVTGTSDTLVIQGVFLNTIGDGTLQNIAGDIFVENSTPNHTMYLGVDDTADPVGRMAVLDKTQVNGKTFYALSGMTSTTAVIYYEGDNDVLTTIDGTDKGANMYTINATGSAHTTLNNNASDTAIVNGTGGPLDVVGGAQTQVGSGTLANIHGDVNVHDPVFCSPCAPITLIVDDSNDMSGAVPSITRPFGGTFYSITGLTPAPAAITFISTHIKFPLQIKLGATTPLQNITHIAPGLPPTDFQLSYGATLKVGGSGTLDGIQSPLVIHGPGNNLVILADEATATAETYTLTDSMLTRSGAASITYDLASGMVELIAGGGGNFISVTATAPSISTVVFAGAAGDTVRVGSDSNTLDTIQGALTVFGAGSNTLFAIQDFGTTTSETYAVYDTSVHRQDPATFADNIAPITYYLMAHVVLQLGQALTGLNQGIVRNIADVFGTATDTIVIGGSGRNSFTVAPFDGGSLDDGNGIRGSVEVFGGGNPYDALTYYDFLDPVSHQAYTMSVTKSAGQIIGGQIADFGFATVSYDSRISFAGLFTTELGGSTVNVLGTAVPTQIEAGTGDSVVVGTPVAGGRTLADVTAFLNIFSFDGNPNQVLHDVTIDDSGDSTFHPSVVINNGSAYPGPDVVNLAQATISWRSLAPATPVHIIGSSGGNHFQVNGFADGDPALTIDGGGGNNTLTVGDQATTSQNWDIASSFIDHYAFGASRPTVPQLTYLHMAAVTVNAGTAQDFIFVQSTNATALTVVNAGGGNGDYIYVENFSNSLDDIRGALQIHDVSPFNLLITDSGTAAAHNYTLSTGQLVRDNMAPITFDPSVAGLVVATSAGGGTVNVPALAGNVFAAIATVTGDNVTIGNASQGLAGINADVRVQAGAGQFPHVTLDDSADSAPHTVDMGSDSAFGYQPGAFGYVVSGLADTRQGRGRIGLLFGSPTPVSILGGSGDDVFHVRDLAGTPIISIDAEPSSSTRTNQHNKLDYSAYTGTVQVVLSLGQATGFASVAHIQDAAGGIGNSMLVGDAGPNILTGGTGRNVLIGSGGADTLDARLSHDDNILIGGTTICEGTTNYRRDLDAIFAEWTRTDLSGNNSFKQRFSDLSDGTGTSNPLNKVDGQLILLNKQTVHSDGAKDTLMGSARSNPLTGSRVHNWFIDDAFDAPLVNFDRSFDKETTVR
jgi:hypothetical protein